MINFEQALEIIHVNNPNVNVTSCKEVERYYVFNLLPEIANSSVHLVEKKTGCYSVEYFGVIKDEAIIKRIDIA